MDGAAEAKVRFKSRYLVDPSAAGDVRAFAQGVVAELTRVQPALMAEVARTVVGVLPGWGEGRREQYARAAEPRVFRMSASCLSRAPRSSTRVMRGGFASVRN